VTVWRTPEELLEHALDRSRLVLVNEAHDGLRRCVRTREIGLRLLPVAHRLGVRHLAMEALGQQGIAAQASATRALADGLGGYLGQPELRALITAALDLGWTLHEYEADHALSPEGQEAENWREDQQARNLGSVVSGLDATARILVWCGNGHLSRRGGAVVGEEGWSWTPMGSLLPRYCPVEPFSIDQHVSVAWDGADPEWLAPFADALQARGGTAGFLADDRPPELAWLGDSADAYLLSLDNALVA
jgi:erythromycin esterase-like protein